MRWFRMHADAVDDVKLRLLAFEDRWHYVAVLCMKCDGILDDHADSGLLDRMVAAKLGLGIRETDEARRRLVEVDLIDEKWQPLGWGKRQYESDKSTARVRKFRHKNQPRNDMKRPCNVSETAPDTDTDTETDKKNTKRRALARPECVSEQAWQDLLTHRKNLKAPLTATAWNAIAKEIDKAGLTPDAGIAEMLARGWRGFKSEWLEGKNEKPGRNYEQPEDRRRRELADYIARAEGGAGVAETGGNARSAVLEGVWERAE
jgi:hypothetical protein